MPEYGLPDATLVTLRQILAACPAVEEAILYGSRAMGNYRPGSDIDLTLTGPGLDQTAVARIAGALADSTIP
jgi:predicted nucleotidyltransferase